MGETTTIEWTDTTWNPVTGCDRVSPGCAHCYALTLAGRLKRMGQPRYQRDGDPRTSGPGFAVTLHPDTLGVPLRWRRPRMVFVNSMSDLFHEEIPDEYIAAVFGVMAAAPRHVFQILTKRPERMRDWFAWHAGEVQARNVRWARWRICEDAAREHVADLPAVGAWQEWPLQNVWLGVSVENRRFVRRADVLRQVPAAVRFISAEPLLGPLLYDSSYMEPGTGAIEPCWRDTPVVGLPGTAPPYEDDSRTVHPAAELDLSSIDWLIVGGESGPRHRRVDAEWVRNLRDAARAFGTAFFFKQDSGPRPGRRGRFADEIEWPREVPYTSTTEEE